jgi:hypothetical protein
MNPINHDQRFKQVLEAFFRDFVSLFDPATAARLDWSTLTFRNPETFTDIPQGERRTADIVAQVQTLDGTPELVIVHVEIQRERQPNFPWRMWQYYVTLRLRENLPIVPIALVFYAGEAGIAREEYEEAIFGEIIMLFRYLQISLPLLSPWEYIDADSILGAGLASVMGTPPRGQERIALYRACLQRVLDAVEAGKVDAARAF